MAQQCPRISSQFLAEERRALGERWFNQDVNFREAEAFCQKLTELGRQSGELPITLFTSSVNIISFLFQNLHIIRFLLLAF
jgi:hypothetical protein